MPSNQRLFINVEDALNFIELHEAKGDLHLYTIVPGQGIRPKQGLKAFWATLLHSVGLGKQKKFKLELIADPIHFLRDDFSAIHNPKIEKAILNLEALIEEAKTEGSADIDPLISELRRFRVALRNDADFKLKRLQVMVNSCNKKIEKLKEVDRHWVPAHILDFLCEIEDEIKMYEDEHFILEKGHKVYSSIIERSREIDQEMDKVRENHLKRLPNALNWGLTLTLVEMGENGIPELEDIQKQEAFEVNPDYVKDVEKKYGQLRRLYLKHHSKLRNDLKGSFDNNFAELEGRLYFAQQVLKQQLD